MIKKICINCRHFGEIKSTCDRVLTRGKGRHNPRPEVGGCIYFKPKEETKNENKKD